MNTLKTIAKWTLGLIIVFGLLFLLAYSQTHYTREGFINPTEYENEYEFEDLSGNLWIFFSDDNIEPHTHAQIKMFNSCTEEYIEDDMIIDYVIIEDNEIKNQKPKITIEVKKKN